MGGARGFLGRLKVGKAAKVEEYHINSAASEKKSLVLAQKNGCEGVKGEGMAVTQ